MTTAPIEEVQAHLDAFIAQMKPGEELLITEQDRPVARLVAEPTETHKTRQPGSAIGTLTIVEDDDVHLEDFKEHMP